MTNGQELGDPTCTWLPGEDILLSNTTITHPGIAISFSNTTKLYLYSISVEQHLSLNKYTVLGIYHLIVVHYYLALMI